MLRQRRLSRFPLRIQALAAAMASQHTDSMERSRVHNPDVPYFSQWESHDLILGLIDDTRQEADDPFWQRSGARTVEEYAFWSRRACGIACLRMILAYRGLPVPPSVELALECEKAGGYLRHPDGVHGLIYAPFVTWIGERFNIQASVCKDLPIAELVDLASNGKMVIASVHHSIRWPHLQPLGRGGHLVLVTGAGDDELVFNNPSGLPQVNQHRARLADDVFDRFYAARGIIIQS